MPGNSYVVGLGMCEPGVLVAGTLCCSDHHIMFLLTLLESWGCQPGGFKHRNVFFHILGAGSSKLRHQQGRVPSETWRKMPSFLVSAGLRAILGLPQLAEAPSASASRALVSRPLPYKDTSHPGLGPTLSQNDLVLSITSAKAPFPNKATSEVLEVRTSMHHFWEDTVQPMTMG